MDEITLKALAKINLGLDVVRRREDGYHEVRMIMQTIHLYDLLEIQKIREPEIQIVSNLSFLPVNENNLVYKTAVTGRVCAYRWNFRKTDKENSGSGGDGRRKHGCCRHAVCDESVV